MRNPIPEYPIPEILNLIPDTRYQIPATLNPIPGMLNSIPELQHMALEMWFTVDDDSIPYAGLAAVTHPGVALRAHFKSRRCYRNFFTDATRFW